MIAIAVATIVAGCAGEQRIRYQPAKSVKKSIYVVKKGDTLTKIAARFGLDVQSIKRANNLKRDLITRGQRLVIPPAGLKSSGKKFGARKKPASYKKRVAKKKKKVHYSQKAPNINLKLIWPLKNGKVTSRFGIRKSGKHDGLDIGADKGTKIYSAAKGKVVFSGKGPTGYGLLVVVKHTNTVYTVYAHNSKNLAKKGNHVKRGEILALVGRTGRATNNHLHFEVRVNRVAYDPLEYLPKRPL